MGTHKKRGNGEGTIFKREINGKTFWVTEYTIAMYDEKTGKRNCSSRGTIKTDRGRIRR